MPLAASYHLAALIVVSVFGAPVLCFVSWRDKAIKLNVEIEADACSPLRAGSTVVPTKGVRSHGLIDSMFLFQPSTAKTYGPRPRNS